MSQLPMTSAALPPRVTRPSTAPSTKPGQTSGNINNNNPSLQRPTSATSAAFNSRSRNLPSATTSATTRSRPSSAQIISSTAAANRPFAAAIAHNNNHHQLQRPSSGYSTRPSSGGTIRSIATTTAAANNNNASNIVNISTRSAAVSSVKGDILLLQRTVDKITSSSSSSSSTTAGGDFPQKDGLFEVEQILANEFPPLLPGDETLAADMHAKLLELFVQRLNFGCLEALKRLDPGCVESVSLVSRTSAVNALLQKIVGSSSDGGALNLSSPTDAGGDNNSTTTTAAALLSAQARRAHQQQHVQTQTHSIGGLSAPEITDFQALLKEQREIQSQMKYSLSHPGSTNTSGSGQQQVPPLGSSSTSKGERAQIRALKEQLEEANRTMNEMKSESSSLQSKLSKSEAQRQALQQEVKELQTSNSKSNRSSIANNAMAGNRENTSINNSKSADGRKKTSSTVNGATTTTTSTAAAAANSSSSSHTPLGGAAGSESGDDSISNTTGRFSRGNSLPPGNQSSLADQQQQHHQQNSSSDHEVVMLNKMTPENALMAALGATVGFFRLDPEILSQVGLDSLLTDTPRYVPDRQYCEQIYSKVSSAISEFLAQLLVDENLLDPATLQNNQQRSSSSANNNNLNLFTTSINKLAANNSTLLTNAAAATAKNSKPTKKDKNENSPEALSAKMGALWWILEKQNATVQAMQLLLAKQHDEIQQGQAEHEALDKRTKRMISVLEEKLGHAKSVVQRLMEENEMLVVKQQEFDDDVGGRDSRNSNLSSSTGSQSRMMTMSGSVSNNRKNHHHHSKNVKSSIDDPTPEEERKLYEKNEIRLQRRILELEHTNSESHAFVEQAKLNASATNRELQVLKTRVQYLEKELDRKNNSEEKAVSEATRLRDEREGNKKDLREKSISATEALQKVNRLEVELHIAQNIVADLRQREIQLEKSASGAKECQDILKQKMIGERESHARDIARLREENRAAKHEVVVANQILADERQKAVANEREIERLRGLDLQLEALQQNFANYAGAKQAQKEAHDEEERALQACVELIGQDVFALPFDESQGEEEVELLLRRLKDAEESMAAEERTRDTLRNTVVGFRDERSGRKQLATLMSRRYNAIQIFACEQRLRQLQLEQQLQEALVQNDEHRVQYEGAMVELSHARSHEQALLQRNSELEQQRRETLKNKDSAETDVKSLRQTIQRMRIANEEQEAAIVDLGTKLKRREYADEKNGGSGGGADQAGLSNTSGSLKASLGRRK